MESSSSAEMSSKRTLKSTSRRGNVLPRKAQHLSKEELLLALQKKKECNARALKIVEGMLEPNVKSDWFLVVLQHINQSHFQDIIEERAITRLCGYPLCSNELQNISSQQYRISTKLNKVYDIKERKNFCSNKCFKASKFIKNQMHTSPLWLRDIEPVVKFTLLLCTEASGGAGDEVSVQVERVSKKEVKQLLGEDNVRAGTSHKSLAAMVNDLHIVTPLQENTSAHVTEHYSNTDSEKVKTPEETTETSVLDGISISGTCHKSENCLKLTGSCGNSLNDLTCSPKREIPNAHRVALGSRESQAVEETLNLDRSIIEAPKDCEDEKTCQKAHMCKTQIAEKISCDSELFENSVPPPNRVEESSVYFMESLSKSTHMNSAVDNLRKSVICPVSDTELRQEIDINLDSNVGCSELRTESVNQTKKAPITVSNNVGLGGTASNLTSVKRDVNQTMAEELCTLKGRKRPQSKIQSNCTSPGPLGTVRHVEKCAEEWFTMETMCFLFGESALKDMLEQKGESIQAHYKALRTATWDQERHQRFLAICKRLNLLELEDNNFDSQVMSDVEARRRPLPDYDALKREAQSMELKIKAFYNGKMELEGSKVSFAENTKSASTECGDAVETQIPLVHLHSQRALRKKIVLDGLNRVLPDFLRTFGMRPSELTASVRGLISTFALSSTNITFKPQEWSLLGLIVIKLLSLRTPELKQCLQREQSNTYLTLMLMSYKQEAGYLDQLLSWLTDVDKLLAKPQPS